MPVVRFRDFDEKRAAIWNIEFGQVNRKVPLVKRDCDSVLSSQVIPNLRPSTFFRYRLSRETIVFALSKMSLKNSVD